MLLHCPFAVEFFLFLFLAFGVKWVMPNSQKCWKVCYDFGTEVPILLEIMEWNVDPSFLMWQFRDRGIGGCLKNMISIETFKFQSVLSLSYWMSLDARIPTRCWISLTHHIGNCLQGTLGIHSVHSICVPWFFLLPFMKFLLPIKKLMISKNSHALNNLNRNGPASAFCIYPYDNAFFRIV